MNFDKKSEEESGTIQEDFLFRELTHTMLEELKIRSLPCENQKSIAVSYKGKIVGTYVSDVIVAEKVIVEVKACEKIEKIHEAQLLNYLKATGYEVGLILNFAKTKLDYKRLVLTKETLDSHRL